MNIRSVRYYGPAGLKRFFAFCLAVTMTFSMTVTGFAETVGPAIVSLQGGSTQCHTVGNYQSAYAGSAYRSYDMGAYSVPMDGSNGNPDICVPGLSQADNMIPQGLSYWAHKNWILISSYSNGGSKASCIYAVDASTGRLVAQFNIMSGNSIVTDHVSGIACSEHNLYVASQGSTMSYVPLSELDVSEGTVKNISYSGTVNFNGELNDANTSYASYGDGIIWTGNFYIEGDSSYGTKANASSGTMMLGYNIGSHAGSAEEWSALTALAGNPTYIIPLDAYGINKVQCATVKNGYCYVGTSYGRTNSSYIHIFNVDLMAARGTLSVNNKQKPFISLHNQRTYSHLPMTEGLLVYDGYLWNIFESAAYLYNGQGNLSTNPTDVLWRFDISSLLGIDREIDDKEALSDTMFKASNTTFGDFKFIVPETIYLNPSDNSFQYYMNDTSSGTAGGPGDSSGHIYYSYPGASSASLMYKFYSGDLSTALSGCSATVSSGTISSGGQVNITAGSVPSGKSAYIEWKLSFTDSADGKTKAAYAYTCIYAPYTAPVFAATRSYNYRGVESDAQSMAWIEGVHGSGENGNVAPNASGFDPMKGVLTTPTNGENNGGYTQDGGTYNASSGSPKSGNLTNYDNNNSANNDDNSSQAVSPRAYLAVDTSRYSNLNEIPNLQTGFMISYVNEGSASVKQRWFGYYFSDFSNQYDSSVTSWSGTNSGAYLRNLRGTYIVSDTAKEQTTEKIERSYCRPRLVYRNTWDKSVSEGSSTYAVLGAVRFGTKKNQTLNQRNSSANCANICVLDVTAADKSVLRASVMNAIKIMPLLGINNAANGEITSLYFCCNEDYRWTAFQRAYKNAVMALTNPACAYNVDFYADELDAAISNLHTKITVDANGGMLSGDSEVYIKTGSNGNAVYTPVQTATRQNYTFLGWSVENPSATAGTSSVTVGYNNTIYAVWAANYSVRFNGNGSDSGSMPNQDFIYNEAQNLDPNAFVKTGYFFKGWNTAADGSGTPYADEANVSNLTSTAGAVVDLYAQWTLAASPDTYVLDSGLPVKFDVLANDANGAVMKSVQQGNGYTAEISDGKILFTPSSFLNNSVTFTYTVRYNSEDYDATVTVIPATSVYYEEGFISTSGQWTAEGETMNNVFQSMDSSYGFIDSYDLNNTVYSLGSALKATVNTVNKGGNEAEFTFSGTGFRVYSAVNNDSGLIVLTLKQGEEVITRTMINTYFGYEYGRIYEKDGKLTLDSSGTPVYYAPEGEQGEYIINGYRAVTTVPNGTNYAYGWIAGKTGGLYQVPVIEMRNLDYGTYTVIIEPRYSALQDAEGKGEYSFWLDSVRIYDPVNPAQNSVEETVYTSDKEYGPQYRSIRNILIDNNSFGNTGNEGIAGVAFLETADNSKTAMENYKTMGPKTEVWLNRGQAVAFTLTAEGAAPPDKIAIGMRCAKNAPGKARVVSSDSGVYVLGSSTEMFRDISGCITWVQTASGWKSANPVIIVNNSDNADTVISLTDIKWSYASGTANNLLSFFFSPSALTTCKNMINAMIKEDNAPDTDNVNISWDREFVSFGETAVLTITVPLNFGSVAIDGELVGSYTENESSRQWTYRYIPDTEGEIQLQVSLLDTPSQTSVSLLTPVINAAAPGINPDNIKTEWESSNIRKGAEAVLNITTPSDISTIIINNEELLPDSVSENNKTFIYKITPVKEGIYKYTMTVNSVYGKTATVISPALIVSGLTVTDDDMNIEWNKNENNKNVLKITTPFFVDSVTVDGKAADYKVVGEQKIWTCEVEGNGENVLVVFRNGNGEVYRAVRESIPDNNADENNDNTGEKLTWWQKIIRIVLGILDRVFQTVKTYVK